MADVVLVEPYYGGSHRAWADSWIEHTRHEIVLISHPDSFWRWRLRGGAVTLAAAFEEHVRVNGRPDAVVVSGLVDVAAFAGLARRALAGCPVAMYVHESQLLYPLAPNQRPDTSSALINWQSMVAADAIWFNSNFHRDALRGTLPSLLKSQPSPNHHHLLDPVFDRATVLWPGVATEALVAHDRTARACPRVLWNQRWDHDKNPHAVFAALAQAADDGVDFTLALAGQNQRPDHAELRWAQDRLGDRIDHVGYLAAADYRRLLMTSDVVVSAADHEFFGIALVEAIAAGAVPVLPHRLSFPELIEARWHEQVLYGEGMLRTKLTHTLTELAEVRRNVDGLRESMLRFDASRAALDHDRAVDQLIG